MAFSLTQIENLTMRKVDESSLILIFVEYAMLKQKLDTLENQTLYFKKGVEAKKQELLSLAADFEVIRVLFNQSTKDCFLDEIYENNLRISRLSKAGGLKAVLNRVCNLLRDKNGYLEELIRLKTKTAELMPMDFYLEDPEALMEIIG